MKKKPTKKLTKKLALSKETLRNLETGDLRQVAGGVSDYVRCFTQTCPDVCETLFTRATC
ncbi:MAG TPA: class I lanthipeptide [Thermoanaerobaculia bacterium]|nr:class I lanthipeptide [Thermoanaerobaculia bacterium]